MLFSSAYFAPLSWYAAFLSDPGPQIDRHEHYRKQSWRNRCRIMGPNGMQELSIPVHLQGNHTPMHEVRISYESRWQQQHWGAIRSAYGQSPFFAFYADYFSPFYDSKKREYLCEYNDAILGLTLRLLKTEKAIASTTAFFPYTENDLRLKFSPKKNTPFSLSRPYIQVFSDRHGFVPDLSIIDLLCCAGPAAKEYLVPA